MKDSKAATLLTLVLLVVACSGCGQQATPAQQFPTLSGAYFGKESPGITPQLFAPEVFQGKQAHSVCVFSPDGKEFCWAEMTGTQPAMNYLKLDNGVWTAPTSPAFARGFADSPTFSPDGSKLYFLKKDDAQQIYSVAKTGQSWATPTKLPDAINSRQIFWQMSVTADGSLYFGGMDIYLATQTDGQYAVSRLESSINTSLMEYSPYVAKDGSYLLFSRADAVADDADLLVSFRNGDGSWGEPVKLAAPVNDTKYDHCPWVSDDGKYLFFVSTRGGTSQIYWVDASVIEAVRPK